MVLAELIKNSRNIRKLTLREVARLTKIPLTMLCNIETSKNPRPKMDILYQLSAFYNLPSDDVCIAATRVPQDVFFKIIRCPQLLQVIRDYPE